MLSGLFEFIIAILLGLIAGGAVFAVQRFL